MKKSDIQIMPQFFDRYINLVEDIEIVKALEKYADPLLWDKKVLGQLGDRRYAEGKWTVKDILQHIIDNERIQSYRALRFARKDKSILPGYDEALYGSAAHANNRSLDDLLEEFSLVRTASLALFKSFDGEMLRQEGVCFNTNISVLALGFVLVGHQIHHANVIRERYYPLLK